MKYYKEIELPGAEGKKAYLYEKESIVLLRELSDNCTQKQAQKLLEEAGGDVLFAVGELSDMFSIRCLCRTEYIRALELVEYVLGQFGSAKGSAVWAQGSISGVLLSVNVSESEAENETEYFMQRIDEYFMECEVVMATTFAEMFPDRIKVMKEYEKAPVSWAYVKSTEIAPAGTQLSIRTLENDTGVLITSRENIYIMIGCRGEVYQIEKEKFESSYTPSDEPLDIFTKILDFIPAVEIVGNRDYVLIDELARLCYPKKGASILAGQLEKGARVFAKNGTDYFVGKKGDYMAVRKDDLQDIYIIQGEVFKRTYQEKRRKENI